MLMKPEYGAKKIDASSVRPRMRPATMRTRMRPVKQS